MKRLTRKSKTSKSNALPESGVTDVECFNRLSDYEDLGLTPDEISQKLDEYERACAKIKKYEGDEESGLIARLPVKYGDTLYEINEERETIDTFSFIGFESVSSFGGALKPSLYGTGYIIGRKSSNGNKVYVYAGHIGKTVFQHYADAEAALLKLRDG